MLAYNEERRLHMTENKTGETTEATNTPKPDNSNTVVLRIPKLNLQVAALGVIAAITLFQTVQLARISTTAKTASVQAAASAPATTATNGTTGTGSNADVPQSMVGGC